MQISGTAQIVGKARANSRHLMGRATAGGLQGNIVFATAVTGHFKARSGSA
jgi:hypothetical protein